MANEIDGQWIKSTVTSLEPIANTGVAVVVVDQGKQVASYVGGYANRKNKKSVGENTLFQIGSVTKGFVGYLLARADADRVIDLKKAVNAKVKTLDLNDDEVEDKLTPEDILSQRSGLPANDLLWVLSNFSRSELVSRIKYLHHRPRGFRNSFIYNNLLYMSLADYIKRETNTDWFDYLSSKVLKPNLMVETFTDYKKFTSSKNKALPYFKDREIPAFDAEKAGPAGALVSNLVDMHKWLVHLTNGSVRDEVFDRLISKHNSIPNPEGFVSQGLGWFGKKLHYGLGWFIGEILGRKIVFNPGNIDGFSSLVIFVPEDRFGAIILTNQSISPFPGRLAQKIFSKWYDEDLQDSFSVPLTSMSSKQTQRLSSRLPIGEYSNKAYGKLIISKDSISILGHKWDLKRSGESHQFTIELFGGMPLPMSAAFDATDSTLRIPLHLDPMTNPVAFKSLIE